MMKWFANAESSGGHALCSADTAEAWASIHDVLTDWKRDHAELSDAGGVSVLDAALQIWSTEERMLGSSSITVDMAVASHSKISELGVGMDAPSSWYPSQLVIMAAYDSPVVVAAAAVVGMTS
jgi:hypothetical protein